MELLLLPNADSLLTSMWYPKQTSYNQSSCHTYVLNVNVIFIALLLHSNLTILMGSYNMTLQIKTSFWVKLYVVECIASKVKIKQLGSNPLQKNE